MRTHLHLARHISLALALAFALALANSSRADTLHVPGDYPTIQEAIEAASDGDEIIVAPGTYSGAINFLGKAVHLRSSDGPEKTIIDASGLKTSVVTMTSGEGPETIIEGFTITGGEGTFELVSGPPLGLTFGGGILIDSASPTILACIVTQNSAALGGGIAVRQADSPAIQGCIVEDNVAAFTINGFQIGSGGGLWLSGGHVIVNDCAFKANTATGGIGGVAIGSSSTLFMSNCVVEGNAGIGIFASTGTLVEITDCLVRENSGTGLDVRGSATMMNSQFFANEGRALHVSRFADALILGGLFEHNGAEVGTGGGPAILNLGTVHIEYCEFRHHSGGFTGAIQNGCTVYNADCDKTGYYCTEYTACATMHVVGCTFVENHATVLLGAGGAIANRCFSSYDHFVECAQVTVEDSTFISNSAGQYGGAIANLCVEEFGEYYCPASEVIGSTFIGNSAGVDGVIATTVQSTPLVAGGTTVSDSAFCGNLPNNIFGDWDDDGGNQFTPPADLDCDGSVGVADLLILLAAWGECEDLSIGGCPADLDGDGSVGVADLLILLANWG